MLLRVVRILSDLCLPLVGVSVGSILVWRSLSEEFQKPDSGGLLVSSKHIPFAFAVLIASLLLLLSLNERRFPSRVVGSKRPLVAVRVNVIALKVVALFLMATSFYALLLDTLGLLQGNPFKDIEALSLKLAVLILSVFAAMKVTPYVHALPVHLLDGIVINSRDVHYGLQEALLAGLNQATPIAVTSFEQYTRPYVAESEVCERWMKAWQTRVAKKKIAVRQILRAYNEHNLVHDTHDRITRFAEHPGYQIRLLISPPELPIIDVYVEGNRYAVLCFPLESSQPYVVQQYVYVSGKDVLSALERWFSSMWHHALPLNDSTSSPKTIESVRKKLEQLSGIDPGLLEHPAEIVWEAARTLPEAVQLLVEVARRSQIPPFRETAGHIRQAILQVVTQLQSTNPVTLHPSAFEAITLLAGSAHKSVRSTAVLSAKDDYWRDHLDEVVSLQERLALRHVTVQRVFVATSQDLLDAYRSTITRIANSGCEVRALLDVHSMVSDFIIVDDATLILDNRSSATESTQPEHVTPMAKVFADTWDRASPWPSEPRP